MVLKTEQSEYFNAVLKSNSQSNLKCDKNCIKIDFVVATIHSTYHPLEWNRWSNAIYEDHEKGTCTSIWMLFTFFIHGFQESEKVSEVDGKKCTHK